MPQNQKQSVPSKSAKSASQPQSQSHGRTVAVVVAAAVIVVIALVTAFIAPGWALRKNAEPNVAATGDTQAQTTQTADPTPTISASALPNDATELLKAMPDTVLNFARTGAGATTTWSDAKVKPVEEYTLTYSTGDASNDVTIVVAQWSKSDDAKTQYDTLTGQLTGKELASGNIKVSGSNTGAYVTKEDGSSDKAISVWRNDTVVFQATGAKQAVQDLTKHFPL